MWHLPHGRCHSFIRVKRKLYCYAVIFGLRQVVLSVGQFWSEYNITKAVRLSYNLTAGQISLQIFNLQYNFNCQEKMFFRQAIFLKASFYCLKQKRRQLSNEMPPLTAPRFYALLLSLILFIAPFSRRET